MTANTYPTTDEYSRPGAAGKANGSTIFATEGGMPILRTRDIAALLTAAEEANRAGRYALQGAAWAAWEQLQQAVMQPAAGRSIALEISTGGTVTTTIFTPAATSVREALYRLGEQMAAVPEATTALAAAPRIDIAAPPLPNEHAPPGQMWRASFDAVIAHEPARGSFAVEIEAAGAVDAEVRARHMAAILGRSDPRNLPLHVKVMAVCEMQELREIGPAADAAADDDYDDAGDAFRPRDPLQLRELIRRVAARRAAERAAALTALKARIAKARRVALGRAIIAKIEGRALRLPPKFI